jgi:uncharacterized phage protein (TIGR02218 family)
MALTVGAQTEALALARTRKPAEIYRFWNTNNTYYRTSADVPITYDGNVYTPVAIKRGGTRQSLDLTVSTVRLTVSYADPVVVEYLGQSPLEFTFMEIKRVFRNQATKEGLAVFIGVLGKVSFKGLQCQVNCIGIERLLRQKVPRLRYQAKCQLTLYGQETSAACGVDSATYGVAGTVLTIAPDGLSLTHSNAGSYADGYFNLGYLSKTGVPQRMITGHVGTTIYLRQSLVGLAASDSVTLYPGCDKLMTTCASKFNNLGNDALDRFLGYPYIPANNPTMWKG